MCFYKWIAAVVEQGLDGVQSEDDFWEVSYFTDKHKSAQSLDYFRYPHYTEFQEWQRLADNMIVKIALAPERDGSLKFIQAVSRDGVLASLAHTGASFGRCRQAVDACARNFVHLFNSMSGLHHREPGVVGAAFRVGCAFAELICDGQHVHPEITVLAGLNKGDRLTLITDCMPAGLMPDGDFHF